MLKFKLFLQLINLLLQIPYIEIEFCNASLILIDLETMIFLLSGFSDLTIGGIAVHFRFKMLDTLIEL